MVFSLLYAFPGTRTPAPLASARLRISRSVPPRAIGMAAVACKEQMNAGRCGPRGVDRLRNPDWRRGRSGRAHGRQRLRRSDDSVYRGPGWTRTMCEPAPAPRRGHRRRLCSVRTQWPGLLVM